LPILYNNNTVFRHALGLWSIVYGLNIMALNRDLNKKKIAID
jgi:hypothetical protein